MILSTRPTTTQSGGCLGCASGRGMSGGLGLFDTGVFDWQNYGLTEWLIVGGSAFLALSSFGLLKFGGGSSAARRKKLQLARAKYQLERAEL